MSNVSVLRNSASITARVAEILSQLPKGHSRSDAFAAINSANIRDNAGKRIQPSVWYHALCYNVKANGQTIMSENYPGFAPTASPYARTKVEPEKPQVREVNIADLNRISRNLAALASEVDSILSGRPSNAIHATIHANDRTGMEETGRRRRNAS